jgi:hypothetical protein
MGMIEITGGASGWNQKKMSMIVSYNAIIAVCSAEI